MRIEPTTTGPGTRHPLPTGFTELIRAKDADIVPDAVAKATTSKTLTQTLLKDPL